MKWLHMRWSLGGRKGSSEGAGVGEKQKAHLEIEDNFEKLRTVLAVTAEV